MKRTPLVIFYGLFSIIAFANFFREQLGLSRTAVEVLQWVMLAISLVAIGLFVWGVLRGYVRF